MAARTVVYLFGGFVVAMALGTLIGAPSGSLEVARNVAAGLVALACMAVAAALWARDVVARAGGDETRRAAWLGALGFAPAVIVVGVALTLLEPVVLARAVSGAGAPRRALPVHVVYALLFVPSAVVVACASAWSVAVALRLAPRTRRRIALATGASAGAAYLVIYLAMELAGWRVGDPGAGRRATMVVVTALGALGATAAGGATLGAMLLGREGF